jgi:hypothetical protein
MVPLDVGSVERRDPQELKEDAAPHPHPQWTVKVGRASAPTPTPATEMTGCSLNRRLVVTPSREPSTEIGIPMEGPRVG